MAEDQKPLSLYFVVGEESGDILGADLITAMRGIYPDLEIHGLAGERMQSLGVRSLFDISQISVMGFTAVLARLPKLLRLISRTVADVVEKKPDVLVLIDSPEFGYRVARKVRAKAPGVRIIKYVAPSVWAWRPGRAKKIKPFIDHIMAVLPFEPKVLAELEGPEATYVGHPLASKIPNIPSASKQRCSDPPVLVALPGSRMGEVKRLMPVIGQTLEVLKERGNTVRVILPAVSKLETEIRQRATQWAFTPEIVTGDDARLEAFKSADLALAASGTVTFELALYKVPTISIYKLDMIAMRVRFILTGWTASLPNLIADYPIVPEKFNEYAHPHYIARMIERMLLDGHERRQQLEGFDLIEEKVSQDMPSQQLVAHKILELAGRAPTGKSQ